MAVDSSSIKASDRVFSDWLGRPAPQVASNLASGFAGQLRWNKEWNGVKEGVHVLPNVRCCSLVAVRIPNSALTLAEVFDKLKATLRDGSTGYQLTVSSKVLKEAWRKGGLPAANDALPARREFHVRVGLARPFQAKCFAILNGVL
jgi:hypothetical protein